MPAIFYIPTGDVGEIWFSTSSSTFGIITIFYLAINDGCVVISHYGLICIYLMVNDVDPILYAYLPSVCSLW